MVATGWWRRFRRTGKRGLVVATGLQTVRNGRKPTGLHAEGRKKLGEIWGKVRARGWEEEFGENFGEFGFFLKYKYVILIF